MTWWPVSPPLAQLVDWIYVFRASGPNNQAIAGALLPQVQWRLAGHYAWRCRDGVDQPIPNVAALGPSAAAISLLTSGETVVVGTGLFPEGWATLLPMAAGDVAEHRADTRLALVEQGLRHGHSKPEVRGQKSEVRNEPV